MKFREKKCRAPNAGNAMNVHLRSWIVAALLSLGIVLCLPGRAVAGEPGSPFWAPDTLVVRVVEVPAGEWTFGNPAKITVEIGEVLRGKDRKGRLEVLWAPAPNDIDTTGREKELEVWNARKTELPKPGTRWILWCTEIEGVLYTRADGRLAWSEKNLARAREIVAQMEKSMKTTE